MSPALSIFLDLVRFSAALLVFLHHAAFPQFGAHISRHFAGSGTEPVIAFFVLSGFVIAYTAENKDTSFREYWISRLARLLSVSLSAIAFTLAFDNAGRALDPALYIERWTDPVTVADLATPAWIRIVTTASFTNEIWWLDVWPGTNSPFWSLGYEVAYYLIFSLVFYLRGPTRVALLTLSILVIGPKILLLLPVWLIGVAGWWIVRQTRLSPVGGASIIALAIPTYALFLATRTPQAIALHLSGFGLANYAPGDIVTGLLFVACIIGFSGMQSWFVPALTRWAKPIRLMASMTFTLYLLHYPLVYLLAAMCRSSDLPAPPIVLGGTLGIVFAISRVTEVKKHAWRPVIARVLTTM